MSDRKHPGLDCDGFIWTNDALHLGLNISTKSEFLKNRRGNTYQDKYGCQRSVSVHEPL